VATMLISEQELVMGKPQKKYDPTQDQSQAQANLQGQLQGQAQGQAQGQGQAQLAVQSLDSKSNNDNNNGNGNLNLNGNGNFNANDNKNSVDNNLDNKTKNDTSNEVDNKVNNNVENHIENTVDTKVNVDVNLDLNASGLSAPVIDLHGFTTTDSLVMPQVVNQTLNGGGNEFNIDQVNNLINNATVTDPSVTYGGSLSEYPAGGFHMDAKVAGGDSKIGDSKLGDSAGAGSGVVSSADATLTQDAFTQTITTGANIQFNSLTMEVAGHNLSDGHDILSH
jgi:hypothetical protein